MEKTQKIQKLKKEIAEKMEELTLLEGPLPICSHCYSIRKNENWIPISNFLLDEFGIQCSHSLCLKCVKELYPDYAP